MARPRLEIRPDELSPEILDDPDQASAGEAAAAVRDFLSEEQPHLAAQVSVSAGGGVLRVEATGERALDVLRSVEGLLGIPDRLPEIAASDELPELEWDRGVVEAPDMDRETKPKSDREVLTSRVRYFPLPECEWFDIRQGILSLTEEKITFQSEHRIASVASEGSKQVMEIPLADVTDFSADTWVNLPCVRIETGSEAYRFGWADHRGQPSLIFEIDDWLQALRNRLGTEE